MVATRSAQQAIEEFVEAIAQHYIETKRSLDTEADEDAESFVSAIEQDLKSTLRDRLAELDTVDDESLAATMDLSPESQLAVDAAVGETLDTSVADQEAEFSHGDAPTIDAEFSHDAHPVEATIDTAATFESGQALGATPASGVSVRAGTKAKTRVASPKPSRKRGRSASVETADLPDGYEVLDVLGKGGMGVVYKARHVPLNRIVAVKKIITGADATDEQIDRFQREAEAAARLTHPNIVSVYEVGKHNSMPFFSLEFVEGQALSDLMRETTMSGKAAADLLISVADAIAYSHEKGIIHRDLKPQNILLNEAGEPKVADFGLAKRLDDDDSEKTRAGIILGTPGYMAPEQAKHTDLVGPHTDVYALGCILYYMMTGRAPFTAPTPFETVRRVLRDEPVPPSKLQSELDRDLETICLKALEKDIDRRYATAKEFADELRRYRNHEPILARPITRTERAWKWCRRNPTIAVLTGLAAALALIVMIGGPASALVIYGQKQDVVEAKELADENAELAEKNALVAETNEREAVAAKQVAESNATAAAVQEKNAIDALKSMTFAVQQRMVGRRDLIDLRERLLDTVRGGLERMENNQNTARAQDMIAAGIFVRLGDINLEVGRIESALQEYEKCVAVFEELDKTGGVPNRLINWAKIHQLLGDACRKAGDFPQAIEHHKKSLQLRRQSLKESPSPWMKSNLATSLGKLGSIAQQYGDLDAAHQYMVEAEQLRKELHEQQPDHLGPLSEWLGAKLVLAKVLFQRQDVENGMSLMKEATEEMQELARTQDNQATQRNNAMFRSELAVLQLYRGDAKSAERNFRFSSDFYDKQLSQDPDNLGLNQKLEEALYGLSVANELQGHIEESRELMARVVELRKDALEIEPSNVANRIRLMMALSRAGETSDCIELIDELDKHFETKEPLRYHLACALGQLAKRTKSPDDTAAPNPESLPNQEVLFERALANLKQSIEGGYWKQADLRMDPDLEPLRNRSEFEQMMTSN